LKRSLARKSFGWEERKRRQCLRALRKKLDLSQAAFAARYGFGLGPLKDWEQGCSRPDSAVRAYLRVIEREPTAVQRALDVA
jgi:putative transcriptional regulator